MTELDVLRLAQKVAPDFGYDPLLVLAICAQESHYDPTEARLENGFYRRYTRPKQYPPTSELIMGISYGLMQVMGCSLWEMGYFDPAKAHDTVDFINGVYMVDPELQMRTGCKWLKIKQEGRSLEHALLRYNGRQSYVMEVLDRYEDNKKRFSPQRLAALGVSPPDPAPPGLRPPVETLDLSHG